MLEFLQNWYNLPVTHEADPFFWHTPFGVVSVSLIMVCALIKIFRANLDLITSLYNWVLAGISAIALLHFLEDSNPRHQMMVIVIALAVKKTWDVYKLLTRGAI